MAKFIRQIRYYGPNDNRNQPKGLTQSELTSGSIFNTTPTILQLGVQSFPGMKFSVNGADGPIIIGSTGIYELNVDGVSQINSIRFDTTEVSRIGNPKVNVTTPSAAIRQTNGLYLIIDYIYEEGA